MRVSYFYDITRIKGKPRPNTFSLVPVLKKGIKEMQQFSALHREAITGHNDCVAAWFVAFAYLEEAH